MTNTQNTEKNLKVIKSAIQAVSAEVSKYQNDEALKSVLIQLQYVEGVLENTEKDLSKIARLAIGITTVRMLEDEFPHLTDILMDADRVVKELQA